MLLVSCARGVTPGDSTEGPAARIAATIHFEMTSLEAGGKRLPRANEKLVARPPVLSTRKVLQDTRPCRRTPMSVPREAG